MENSTYKLLEAWNSMCESACAFNPLNEYLNRSINDPITSGHFQTEGKKIPGIGIGFIPGMHTSFDEALHHANHIRKFTNDMDIAIDCIYNHSNGVTGDLLEIISWNYEGVAHNTAKLLVDNWMKFFKENPFGKYLQFAHSQGSILLVAALSMLPEEMQRKITVVTIGTAKVTPKYLKCDSYNYASESDWIHRGEDLYLFTQLATSADEEYRSELLRNFEEAKKRLILLKRHADAKGWMDHDCESPTNNVVYEDHILEYLQKNASSR